jgi:hypothetical protein
VGEDGAHAFVFERALGKAQLLEDVAYVRLDGLRRDVEPLRDAAVGQALGHQAEHFAFPGGQLVERVGASAAVEQLGDEGRVDDDAAGDNTCDRVREIRTRFPAVALLVLSQYVEASGTRCATRRAALLRFATTRTAPSSNAKTAQISQLPMNAAVCHPPEVAFSRG